MTTKEQTWREEQQRVDLVVNEVTQRIVDLTQHVSGVKDDIVEIRKNFWDDVTVNLDEPDDVVETYVSLRQQAEVLSERERSHQHAQKQLQKLKRLQQTPYFGRIDFAEQEEVVADRIYLGIGSLLDQSEENFLVYDWRAPVSSLYYDYPPGPAHYETPGGTVSGELELKRQYIIRDGQIRSLFDTGVTIGDELLQEVLGKQADPQMKSIVATIQKEQNRLIRDERNRLLIVQGAAGSGKTSAALQRVAYLLYRYRETLRAEQIVLFSPNPMFNSYVSTVLPELGEENMQQTTFQEYLEHLLGRTFQLEDPFAQMEYVLTAMHEPGYAARVEGIAYKASTAFLHALDRYVGQLGQAGLLFKDVKFRGDVILTKQAIAEQFYSHAPTLPIPNRLRLVAEWILQELHNLAQAEREKPWVEEEMELLDPESYLKAYQKLRRKKRFTENSFDDFDSERDMLAMMIVQERFKPLRSRVKRLLFLDIPALFRQFFVHLPADADLPANWQDICAQTVERLDRAELAYEDATPYLYLKERMEGVRTNNAIRHVFLDEAQDYTAFQFAYLKRLFPRSKMTVLGDLNQAIFAHAAATEGFAPLAGLYRNEPTETLILTRSYRSTRPIVEFTRGLVAGGESIEPFNRDGEKPTLTNAQDRADLLANIVARIRDLQQAGHQTIAIICKTERESKEAYDALRGDFPLRLIGKETVAYEAGLLVIPSYLAKGVEFDAVILFDASKEQYGRESERKLFYTACTRAMHELHLHYIGEKSPFLSTLDPETYEEVGRNSTR